MNPRSPKWLELIAIAGGGLLWAVLQRMLLGSAEGVYLHAALLTLPVMALALLTHSDAA